MNVWIHLWSWLFFISLGIFAILAVVTTIAGFFNIRDLFKQLQSSKDNSINFKDSDSREHKA